MIRLQAEAKRILEKENASLVLIRNGQDPHVDFRTGLLPLWQAFRQENWKGGVLADRVIGRGAAFLAVGMELSSVYSPLMSRGAIQVLEDKGLDFYFDREVERIKDRSGKGLCPMEALLNGVNQPEKALDRLNRFFLEKSCG